ncbi:MAG: hypothetical protein KatS3mg119_1854 [Rhodothalassiaceae bacterium]|nr:MAG: hypothetical protein KatS3mg119_1854 [Rhodothalassiaceae bacterium]
MRAKWAAITLALAVNIVPATAALFGGEARAIVTDDVIIIVVFDDGTVVI